MADAPTWKTEFPDFVLDVEIPEGFEDVSWRNDMAPCWHHPGLQVFLYVDFADASVREFPDIPRFQINPARDAMVVDAPEILATDDWAEVLAKLDEITASAIPSA